MNLNEKIRNIIEKNLTIFDDDAEFGDDDNFFQLGFLNSLFAMKLVSYIENEFDIAVESEEMDINNFNTVNNIVKYIQSKIEH